MRYIINAQWFPYDLIKLFIFNMILHWFNDNYKKKYTKIFTIAPINRSGSLNHFAHSGSLIRKYFLICYKTPRLVSNRLNYKRFNSSSFGQIYEKLINILINMGVNSRITVLWENLTSPCLYTLSVCNCTHILAYLHIGIFGILVISCAIVWS